MKNMDFLVQKINQITNIVLRIAFIITFVAIIGSAIVYFILFLVICMIGYNNMKETKALTEAKFQQGVIKWLRQHKCVVFKLNPGPGIPDGTPDLLFLIDGFWGMLECKKNKMAKFRPGQKEAIEKYNNMSWCKTVYPENWEEVRKELEAIL